MPSKLLGKFLASAKLRTKAKGDSGFSLVELLVVVLIIGILAAIAVPVFLGQQQQARESAVKSDLANAKIALVSCMAENQGSFGSCDETTEIEAFGYSQSDGVTKIDPVADGTAGFCLEAAAADSAGTAEGDYFFVKDTGGVIKGTCAGGPAA